MERDTATLNTRWLAPSGPTRTMLLAEIKDDAAAWHRGVGLSQSNSISTPLGKQRALAFARAKGLRVIAYTASDGIIACPTGSKAAREDSRPSQNRATGKAVPIQATACALLEGEIARYNLRECAYTPHTFYYIESAISDGEDRANPGMRYTIQVTGDTRGSKQYPSAQYCNRQVGRLVRLYLDPREIVGKTTTTKEGVTYLKYAPRAAAFVPDVPQGVTQTATSVEAAHLAKAGLSTTDDDFPANAIPLNLTKVRFKFMGRKGSASLRVERENIRAVPYTGITTHAAQGANTDKTVLHFCLRMLTMLRDPALVLVALTRVKRLKDLILLTPVTMDMLEWVVACDKGVQRQREWDRLVRSARARKTMTGATTCETERQEWKELDERSNKEEEDD